MSRIIVLEKISREADELARQYNKTKDPGLRDQWYELIKKVSQVESKGSPSRQANLGYNL
jgi:hypothetical protein